MILLRILLAALFLIALCIVYALLAATGLFAVLAVIHFPVAIFEFLFGGLAFIVAGALIIRGAHALERRKLFWPVFLSAAVLIVILHAVHLP
jgi:hypothetical protein